MKLKYIIFTTLVIVGVILYANFNQNTITPFLITQNENGIEVTEDGIPVLFYQKKMKSLEGKYGRNNYIHPLYNLKGEVITEDFPEDHPYHRGIYWAWHQIYVADSMVSDSWVLDNFNATIIESIATIIGNTVVIDLTSDWSSPNYLNSRPYLREKIEFEIHESTENFRIIDIKMTLDALVDSLKIGGADNEKGYGGLCLRIKMPDDLSFAAKNGKIEPQNLQIDAGSWMDFSASFGVENVISGVTLFCHPSNLGYPQKWILRQERSMQNVVFPGEQPIEINQLKPIVLNYRLLIHEGILSDDLVKHEAVYNQIHIE